MTTPTGQDNQRGQEEDVPCSCRGDYGQDGGCEYHNPFRPAPQQPPTQEQEGWDYATHPGDCHPHRDGDTWTTCCRECAGTGVFPVPWVTTVAEGRADPDASCVKCKGSGRAVVGMAAAQPPPTRDLMAELQASLGLPKRTQNGRS